MQKGKQTRSWNKKKRRKNTVMWVKIYIDFSFIRGFLHLDLLRLKTNGFADSFLLGTKQDQGKRKGELKKA